MQKTKTIEIFHKLCWALVVYTVFVIIWGAWVRISHSGDGCGNHWPLCDGAFIPTDANHKTWTEYFHRVTSGLYGIFVFGLFIAALRIFPKKTAVRQAALVTLILTIIEALLGAALVLKGLVGENATIFRLVVMTLHQVNSLLLTGGTVTLALISTPRYSPHILLINWKIFFTQTYTWLLFMIIPATGAWAALANTLFPSEHLQDGLEKDLSGDSPWILKLRVAHPLLALSIGFYLVFHFFKKSEKTKGDLSKASLLVAGSLSVAMIFGILTLLFLSPIWMKLVHLTIALLVWISVVNYVMISLLSTKR